MWSEALDDEISQAARSYTRGEVEGARHALARARSLANGASRQQRQQVEIVGSVINHATCRAAVLGREHLAEFPDDAVVGMLLAASANGGACDCGELDGVDGSTSFVGRAEALGTE